MATFSKQILSASDDGKSILVAASTSPGTLIHTASSNTAVIDEVWVYATNTDASARKLTLQWGGTTSPNDLIEVTIQPEAGLVLLVPGLILKGNASAKTLRTFVEVGGVNLVTIHGYVNRIA